MTKRSRFLLIAFTALAAATVVGVAAVRHRPAAPGAEPAKAAPAVLEFTAADVYDVRPEALPRTLALTGTMTPLVEATVKAKVAGELVEVPVREGQSVKKGQVLARIDQTEVQARVAAREADVAAARAQLVWAEKNRNQQKALLEKAFISQSAFDNVQSNYDVAAAKLRAAEADLVVAKKSLGDSVLVAPFSGVVAERHAQAGERVALDAKVVTVVDLARMELEAAIPAAAIGQARVGQQVQFRVDGFGDRAFEGRIERINPATTAGSRSISVYAVIENPDQNLRKGMFAQGALMLGTIADALVIPVAAVREEAGTSSVYALVDGVVRRKPVKTGPADAAGRVQVLEGLAPGDRIVRSNLGSLREGAAARVAAAAASPAAPAKAGAK